MTLPSVLAAVVRSKLAFDHAFRHCCSSSVLFSKEWWLVMWQRFLMFICERSLNLNLMHAVPPPQKNSSWPLLHMDDSKAWFMEIIRSIDCKNPLTLAQVTLFVVRMWSKHHLLGLKILYRSRLGHRPVYLERFCPKKRQQKSSEEKFRPLRD